MLCVQPKVFYAYQCDAGGQEGCINWNDKGQAAQAARAGVALWSPLSDADSGLSETSAPQEGLGRGLDQTSHCNWLYRVLLLSLVSSSVCGTVSVCVCVRESVVHVCVCVSLCQYLCVCIRRDGVNRVSNEHTHSSPLLLALSSLLPWALALSGW